MKYVVYIVSLFIYSTIITQASISLGLTSTKYLIPDVQGIDDPNPLEGFFIAVNFAWTNMSAFLQLVTLQADIPLMLGLIFAGSLGLGVIIVIVLVIRGIG